LINEFSQNKQQETFRMKKRPTGITVLFWVYLILGILSLLWSGAILGIGGLSAFVGGIFGLDAVLDFGSTNAWSGYIGIITAVIQIIVAFGLASLKKWAWGLAIIGVVLTVVQGIFGIVAGGMFAFICGSIGLIIPGIILFYLLRPEIRSIFNIEN
jgi:hypothetical protein